MLLLFRAVLSSVDGVYGAGHPKKTDHIAY